ncbi:YisL family protein [Bacillus methanolicus]|uniref:UPF0344 protein BMMGA3_04300 n=1 Tax=Bacillus methanolicus (strain MGA3 / ATCC 53907) TaxID=796606 RepID=I3E7K3_BACMM|nr:YisL family protein [Bacillus methanolicus]AIE59300.1 hypothetical protein BMMGA3_04300 [Bacillus methanolicus MGA3]EIJ82474.1 hypothetical protein MGA3_04500 [Bacillus methanolicus MGA3]UQD51373.1 DUF1516 family protein [Bacillus methanolicus]
MTHAHITAWFLALVLFFIALGLHKSGKAKGFRVVQMILRVFYILIVATGVWMLTSISTISLLYILKSAVGLWVIAMLELILIRTAKQQRTSTLWIQFVVAFLLVLYLGFKLPLGFHFL